MVCFKEELHLYVQVMSLLSNNFTENINNFLEIHAHHPHVPYIYHLFRSFLFFQILKIFVNVSVSNSILKIQ